MIHTHNKKIVRLQWVHTENLLFEQFPDVCFISGKIIDHENTLNMAFSLANKVYTQCQKVKYDGYSVAVGGDEDDDDDDDGEDDGVLV